MRRIALLAALVGILVGAACVSQRRQTRAESALNDGEFEEAARIWQSMARRGDATSQYRLGTMTMIGQGVDRDMDEALAWLRKAADQGFTEAQRKLANIYLVGKGNPEDDPNAETWMRQTAEDSGSDPRYRLGVAYYRGEIFRQDTQEALRWFELAAEAWPAVGRRMGDRLRDDELLRPLADLGLDEAQYFLGLIYAEGDGLPQSAAEAAKWFYLAASQDHLPAQVELGAAYGQGRGIPQDMRESARWFRKAADNGYAEAQYQLALMYRRGLGVPLDHVAAHMWFNLAASQGHKQAMQKRDETRSDLNDAQLMEAERMAVEWKPVEPEETSR